MKILILTVTAGEGHNSTAKALKCYFDTKNIECKVLDTFDHINKALSKMVSEGYDISITKIQKAYAGAYRLAENRSASLGEFSPSRLASKILSYRLKSIIDEYNPDVIISTHVFSTIIIDVLKHEQKTRAKTYGIVTDFIFHPFWEEGLHTDYVFTANQLLEFQAIGKGFRPEKILPYGIPIHPKFANKIPKEEARIQLGIDMNKQTLLLMGGGTGYGNIVKNIKKLDEIPIDFQIIVVCGRNQSLKEEIDEIRTNKRLLNFGFTDKIDIIMDASDLIVSKPGGLTTSEALAKELPMVIVNPIPGQEDRNKNFLLNSGVACAVSATYPLEEAIYNLFKSPQRIEHMVEGMKLIRRPNSTRDICDFILNQE